MMLETISMAHHRKKGTVTAKQWIYCQALCLPKADWSTHYASNENGKAEAGKLKTPNRSKKPNART